MALGSWDPVTGEWEGDWTDEELDDVWEALARSGDWFDGVLEAVIESGDVANADLYPHDLFE